MRTTYDQSINQTSKRTLGFCAEGKEESSATFLITPKSSPDGPSAKCERSFVVPEQRMQRAAMTKEESWVEFEENDVECEYCEGQLDHGRRGQWKTNTEIRRTLVGE